MPEKLTNAQRRELVAKRDAEQAYADAVKRGLVRPNPNAS